MVIGTLEISTYQGISIGAVHWYGKLWIEDMADTNPNHRDKCIELTRKLTAKEIRAENLEAGYSRVSKGETTEGFNTREEVLRAGLQAFKSQFKGVLFEGGYACRSAWKNLIFWPPHLDKIAKQMNALAERFQSLNGYEGRERRRVERLDKKWGRLYNTLEIMCKP